MVSYILGVAFLLEPYISIGLLYGPSPKMFWYWQTCITQNYWGLMLRYAWLDQGERALCMHRCFFIIVCCPLISWIEYTTVKDIECCLFLWYYLYMGVTMEFPLLRLTPGIWLPLWESAVVILLSLLVQTNSYSSSLLIQLFWGAHLSDLPLSLCTCSCHLQTPISLLPFCLPGSLSYSALTALQSSLGISHSILIILHNPDHLIFSTLPPSLSSSNGQTSLIIRIAIFWK